MAEKSVLFRLQQTGAEQVSGAFGGVENSLAGIVKGLAAAYISFASLKKAFNWTIVSAVESEKIFRKLQTSIEVTGESWKDSEPDIRLYLKSLQTMTGYCEDETAEALSRMLIMTGNLKNAMFALPIVLGLVSQEYMDMDSAARAVGMAMEGETLQLSRMFPQFRHLDDELGKNATIAQRAEYAMKLLNEKFGTGAQKNLETVSGQYKALKTDFDNLGKSIGKECLPWVREFIQGLNWIITAEEDLTALQLWQQYVKLGGALSLVNWKKYYLGIKESEEATKDFIYQNKKIETVIPDYIKYGYSIENVKNAIENLTKARKEAYDSAKEFGFEKQIRLQELLKEEMKTIPTEMPTWDFGPDKKQIEMWRIANDYAEEFGRNIGQAVIYGRNLGDAVVASLKAIAAELASKAAIYAIISLITGSAESTVAGLVSGGKSTSFLSYLFGGMFQQGGDFMATKPQLIMVGEGNRPERVQITPQGQSSGGNTINLIVQGNILSEEVYVRRRLIPELNSITENGGVLVA